MYKNKKIYLIVVVSSSIWRSDDDDDDDDVEGDGGYSLVERCEDHDHEVPTEQDRAVPGGNMG